MSSVVNDDFYYDLQSLFRELPVSAQQSLGDRLMTESAWKQVADRVRFSTARVDELASVYGSRAAWQMLREWGCLGGSTLRVLRQTLGDIQRRDIISFLSLIHI